MDFFDWFRLAVSAFLSVVLSGFLGATVLAIIYLVTDSHGWKSPWPLVAGFALGVPIAILFFPVATVSFYYD